MNTELIATQHILSEEENKSQQQEQDIEQLSLELDNRANLLQQTQQKNKMLNVELRNTRDKLDSMEVWLIVFQFCMIFDLAEVL